MPHQAIDGFRGCPRRQCDLENRETAGVVALQPGQRLLGSLVPAIAQDEVVLEECGQQPGATKVSFRVTAPHSNCHLLEPIAPRLDLAGVQPRGPRVEARVQVLQGDLFAAVGERTYDLVITNPPYVGREVMEALPAEFRHEPAMALDGGDDGFDIVRRILTEAGAHLNPGGGLLCEIGTDRVVLEADYPDVPFLWLDTELSEGEVFWLERGQLPG